MKTENNIKNKIKFFAQYYGQNIFKVSKKATVFQLVDAYFLNRIDSDSLIELKSVRGILDDDAVQIAMMLNCHVQKMSSYNEVQLKAYCIGRGLDFANRSDSFVNVYQFLQSKGYALPYMDLSVQDLVDYGWIHLKDNN